MTSEPSQLTTFERSCRHWSESGRVGMEAFYRLANKDYRLLATSVPWASVFAMLRKSFGDRIRLLDVACGSGQFPSALREHGGLGCTEPISKGLRIEYSLLDPTQFSIDTAKAKLGPPFEPDQEILSTIQELNTPERPYPVVWATHALYCIPPNQLGQALERMLLSTDPRGFGFIAHASKSAHYLRFHDLYLDSSFTAAAEPYCSAEQVLDSLRIRLAPTQLHFNVIDYEGSVELGDHETVERYRQRCLFDDQLTLDQMLADERLGAYLRDCMDSVAGKWRFPQQTFLIFYGDFAEDARGWV